MEVKMAIYKAVIGNKKGETVQKELSEEQSDSLVGKKIGEIVKGDGLGFEGYEFQITGGSDTSGTPMRSDAEGVGKRKVLAVSGIGIKKKRDGQKQRKTVCGNTISGNTTQVNMKVIKEGKSALVEKKEEKEENNDAKAESAEKTA
jgi:small subunit ribosomal protein S6e